MLKGITYASCVCIFAAIIVDTVITIKEFNKARREASAQFMAQYDSFIDPE